MRTADPATGSLSGTIWIPTIELSTMSEAEAGDAPKAPSRSTKSSNAAAPCVPGRCGAPRLELRRPDESQQPEGIVDRDQHVTSLNEVSSTMDNGDNSAASVEGWAATIAVVDC